MEGDTALTEGHDDGRKENRGSGGRRKGPGVKRLHERGYKDVYCILWKNITVHTDVFNKWVRMKHISRKELTTGTHIVNDTTTSNRK